MDDTEQDDDKQTVSEVDDKQSDEPNNIVNDIIYDYLPQGIIKILPMLFIYT
jgi:hypothetical protein